MEHVSSVRPSGKFPEKVENLKRWSRFPGWNFRTGCRVPFSFLVVCTSSRSTLGHRHVPGFMTKWNNFLPIGNSTLLPPKFPGFFPKWKAPLVFTLRSKGELNWTRAFRPVMAQSVQFSKIAKKLNRDLCQFFSHRKEALSLLKS